MAGKGMGYARKVLLLFIVCFAALACAAAASAADEELLRQLPGQWTEENEGAEAVLVLDEDGKMSLRCSGGNGEAAFTCEGTWSFEFVPDRNDRLTLRFTSTDDPLYEGSGYGVECVYEAYTESWVENDRQFTYLILTPVSSSGVSPFEGIYGEWEVTLHREQGPNMRVVHCKDYVSLREKRSKSSARLAKVPLGAQVLAFEEAGEENGFIYCVYHDAYGYILSEYLEPMGQ